MRTFWWSFGFVLACLVGLLFLQGGAKPAAREATPKVALIARRVQGLRGLKFSAVPVPQRVSGAQARREGLEDLDRSYPAARRHADEEVLKLLGLIGARVDLRAVSASVFGEGVAGYYDPRSKRLRIVNGAVPGSLTDIALAHELTHALEDQTFGIGTGESSNDDRALADLALVEGSATDVMQEYLLRYIGAGAALGSLLGSLDTGPALPSFLQDQLLFPYESGLAFVQALKAKARGRWTLVDLADQVRPPDSTEQVLHPDKWIAVETPRPVRLSLGLRPPWRRALAGTFGEFQTRELLGGDAVAAAGWGGDRYELWQRPAAGCAVPCRSADVLVMRWRWDTPADVSQFARAVRRRAPRGAVIARRGDAVTLALAPTAALAGALAASIRGGA